MPARTARAKKNGLLLIDTRQSDNPPDLPEDRFFLLKRASERPQGPTGFYSTGSKPKRWPEEYGTVAFLHYITLTPWQTHVKPVFLYPHQPLPFPARITGNE